MTTGDQPGYGQDPSAPWTSPLPPPPEQPGVGAQNGPPGYGQPSDVSQPSGYAQPYGQQYAQPYGQQYAQPYGQQYGQYGYPPYGYAPSPTTNTLAIVSFVASVANLVLCGVGSIVGLICGFIALRQIKQRNEGGRGLAIAGIVISLVFLLLVVVGVVVFVAAVSSSQTTPA